MAKDISRNLKLGIFVAIGVGLLILSLYYIGNTNNLFGTNFKLQTTFKNVDGLTGGNSVRFSGIDVGTVESVKINNDSSILVVLVIRDKVKEFIKKDAVATLGTDGLIGSKIVNISAGKNGAPAVEEGDMLQSRENIETDEMLRTLNATNENVMVISSHLRALSEKLSDNNSFLSVLMDTALALDIKSALDNIKRAGENTAMFTGDLHDLTNDIKQGKGTLGMLLTDAEMEAKVKDALQKIQNASSQIDSFTKDLAVMSDHAKSGNGSVGSLVMDTAFAHRLNQSLENVNEGVNGFTEVMEALKHNIFLRGYFRKQEKKKEKEEKP